MDLKPFLLLALLLAVLGFLLTGPGFSSTTKTAAAPVSLEVSSPLEQAPVGETLELSATASGAENAQIELEFEGKIQSFSCTQTPCVAVFEIAPGKKGILFATVTAKYPGGVLSKKIPIRIVAPQSTCIDLTLFGECSKEKPFFCLNGGLVPDCEKCGCPESTKCMQNACAPESTGLELTGLKQAKTFVTPATWPSFVVFAAALDKKAMSGAQYTINAYLYSPDANIFAEKNFSLENELLAGNAKEIEIQFQEPLAQGTFSLRVELFGEEKLSEKTFENALVVREPDNIAPSTPLWLGWSNEGEKTRLNWRQNPEDDVKDYIILQSSGENPGYIAYSALAIVPATETSFLADTPIGGGFFVLSAVDWYGNKSGYSEVLEVNN
ncbi:MAG: hypothetical protein HY392_05430 [Candidatus Diapherotrites archaeon]|nr:hypothetical protein [Candidatus Diapherotrites archaeon]